MLLFSRHLIPQLSVLASRRGPTLSMSLLKTLLFKLNILVVRHYAHFPFPVILDADAFGGLIRPGSSNATLG